MGGAVPVVLGPSWEQYEAVAPKDSFIHVADFSSMEDLGESLRKLAEDKQQFFCLLYERIPHISTGD